jgi:hypothetical protein
MSIVRDEHESSLDSQNWKTWLIGALFALLMAMGGAGWQALDTRIDDIEYRGSPPLRERIAAVEAKQDAMQRQLDNEVRNIKEATKRIEEKLDRLVEQGRRR